MFPRKFSDTTVSFSKAAMFILLMEWLLIMFAMYGKHVVEPRWWTKVHNFRNSSIWFFKDLVYIIKKLVMPPKKVLQPIPGQKSYVLEDSHQIYMASRVKELDLGQTVKHPFLSLAISVTWDIWQLFYLCTDSLGLLPQDLGLKCKCYFSTDLKWNLLML